MKFILLIIIFLIPHNIAFADQNCETMLQKLKPSCNVIGKGAKKLKKISENNKKINQTLENKGVITEKNKKNFSLKELNKKYKPIKLKKN